jgi:hypothetical protein
VSSKYNQQFAILTTNRALRFAVVSIGWYFIHGKKNFTGPPVPKDADPTIAGEIPEESKESVPTDAESQTISKTQ